MTLALQASGITKRFPGVLANDHIDFSLEQGQIHALLGENGAGKSTLMNILYGLYQPDEGEILLNEQLTRITSPHDAIAQGIGMVHQHFMLVPPLTVTENIMLGQESLKPGTQRLGPLAVLDRRTVAQRIRELSQRYGLAVDPNATVQDLTVGAQQRVEIVKALYREAQILILDEPTAVLTPQEADDLFVIMRNLTAQGKSIIFITHKLREVFAVADQISVMRAGQMVGTVEPSKATREVLAEMMVGRKVILTVDKAEAHPGDTVLEVTDLHVMDERRHMTVDGVTLNVRAGEILGIAGVQGNGQTELTEALTGLRRAVEGRVVIHTSQTQKKGDLAWPDITYAGFWRRALAWLVDFLLLGSIGWLLGYIASVLLRLQLERTGAEQFGVLSVIAYSLYVLFGIGAWMYFAWLESSPWQATLGKRFAEVYVTDIEGKPVSFWRASARYWLRLLSALPLGLGFLMAGLTRKKQALHDMLANCLVARTINAMPRQIIETGTSHVPEDRHKHGLVLAFSVRDNMVLCTYYQPPYAKGIEIDFPVIERQAADLVHTFDVRTPNVATNAGSLSGGNQQKIIVARELSRPVRLLIASQPTRGLDVGSIEFIHRRIIEARDHGAAVLLISAELDEIMSLSDRIAVIYKGHILDTLDAQAATREQLGLLMAGVKEASHV